MIALSKTQDGTANRFIRSVGMAAIALAASVSAETVVQAAPLAPKVPAMTSAGIKAEAVRCNCRHRYHVRRRVERVVPDYYVPVYPAPPVGPTFRKLFDGGYL